MRRQLQALAAATVTFSLGTFGSAAERALNIPQTLADTKAIVSGGGQADIVVLGDSLSMRDGSYLPFFRQLVQSQYGDAGLGYQHFSEVGGWYSSGGVTYGVGSGDNAPHWGVDGFWNHVVPTAWGFAKASSQKSQLIYVAQPGAGAVDVYRNDGSLSTGIGTFDADAAQNEVRAFPYTAPGNNLQMQLKVNDAPVTFLGVNNVTDDSGLRIHRAAHGGWSSSNFVQRNWTFDGTLSTLGTDLVMIMLGQNDQNSMDADQFAANINQLVDRINSAAPEAEVLLISNYDSGGAKLQAMADAEAQIAAQRGIGFINLYEIAGDYQSWLDRGYLDDGIHFSQSGGQYVGNLLYQAFVTDGASLIPEPAAASLLALGAGSALLRRRR